jgi:hypothetical protein
MATLKKIPDAYLTPARQLPEQELADMMVSNPEAARLLTYGTRQPQNADPPHDHAQEGGEVLIYHPACRLTFGPEPFAAGSMQGVVIDGGVLVDGQFTFDVALGPRILASGAVFLPGGTQRLEGYLLVEVDQFEAMTLYVSLRPYNQLNKKFDTLDHPSVQLTFTPATAQHTEALVFADLSTLGDVRYDREYELVIWQAYRPNAPVTFGERVVAVYLDAGVAATVHAGARVVTRLDLQRQSVSYADVKSGAILGQDVGRKMRSTHNALLRGMIGRAPGLLNSDDASDLLRPYTQEVHCAHQHQGIDVPDGCGGYWSDGAVIRDTLFSESFAHRVIVTSPPVPNQDYKGRKIHSSGALDATWVQLEYRASIPAGLGAIDVRLCVESGSSRVETRLLVHADVRGQDGVSICKGITSGVHRHANTLDATGLFVCEVDPLDNDAMEPGRKRKLGRKGLWTKEARRFNGLSPRPGVRNTAHQISEVVRLLLTHPKLDPADSRHQTADYRVLLRLELQITGAATVVDPGAELRWVLGVSSRGF